MTKPLTDAEALEPARKFEAGELNNNFVANMLADFVIARLTPVKPVCKRSLKKRYAYCSCEYPNGAPFIVQRADKFCPGCGKPLDWGTR